MLRFILFLFIILFFQILSQAQQPTWNRDIAPIIFNNCSPCHQSGKIGPMPLTTYQEVTSYGQMVAYVTEKKWMPPFLANAPLGAFTGEKKLTDSEIDKIKSWVRNGMPLSNNTNEIPVAYQSTPALNYDFIPDTVLQINPSFEQYGIYYDQYRVFVLPLNLPEDKWVTDIKFVPSNSLIVRNATISIDNENGAKPWDDWDPGNGYYSFGELGFIPWESRWHSWNPCTGQSIIPENGSLYLPKNANLIVHIHYGPTGIPRKDSSKVMLKFGSKKPEKIIRTIPLLNPYNLKPDSFLIEKESICRYYAAFSAPIDLEIYGLYPHAHLLGKSWTVFVTHPDTKKTEKLLDIDEWNFHWKQYFEFNKPRLFKKGTIFQTIVSYDNTKNNLFNPSDPPESMSWGKKMYEEMFLVYFTYTLSNNTEYNADNAQVNPIKNLTTDSILLHINAKVKDTLTCKVSSFDNTISFHPFINKQFSKGNHSFNIDLSNQTYGNYLLQITNSQGKILHEDLFVRVKNDFLN